MDKITLDQYIKNPSGARTRITGEEEVARNVYTDKYNSSIDHSQYTERKLKQWVIIPVYVQ